MRIVVDTNILISGVFFGGILQKILRASVEGRIRACASMEILNEYGVYTGSCFVRDVAFCFTRIPFQGACAHAKFSFRYYNIFMVNTPYSQ